MADTLARQRTIVGSTADWAAHNLILGDGEIAIERQPDGWTLAKAGNGADPFSASPYIGSDGDGVRFKQVGTDASTRTIQGKAREALSVYDFGAIGNGTADDTAAFNRAAAAAHANLGATVKVPRGTFVISAPTTPAADWELDRGAIISGLPDLGIPTVSTINNTARLTGRMIRQGNAGGDRAMFGPTMRVGDTRGWLENTVRGTTESYATLPVVSPGGGIAITGASRTSDSPDPLNTAMSCIGGNWYAINDTPKTSGQTAYGVYVEAQRKANCGMAYGMELDICNFGPDTLDINPATPLNYDAFTSGIIVNSGGGHPGAVASSAAYMVQWNGTTFKRGLVFNIGCLDGTTNEAVAMGNSQRLAWYDAAGKNVSFMDAANNSRTVDAAGQIYVTDSITRKGGAGAPTGALTAIALTQNFGWTGSAAYQASYTRTLQRTNFAGGNAQFSYDLSAKNVDGSECMVSLNAITSNQFGPLIDGVVSCGAGAARWSVVFASSGAINTCDERLKAWHGGPTDADRRAAARILGELGWFQFLAAIDEKGADGARRHFGARAQAVAQILMDEGIEPSQDLDFPADIFVPEDRRPNFKTAFLTFDTWEEIWQDEFEDVEDTEAVYVRDVRTGLVGDDGKPLMKPAYVEQAVRRSVPTGRQILVKAAGNVFGLRPDQLAFYLMSALAPTARQH